MKARDIIYNTNIALLTLKISRAMLPCPSYLALPSKGHGRR